MLDPVRRRSLSDAVFEQLRDRIVGGEMRPGSALPSERSLCEMLGVNRGALREALKRLEQAKLVSIHHGGATKVADFVRTGGLDLLTELLFNRAGGVDTRVARSVIEMRSALAPDIARRAAQRAPAEVKDRLLATVSQMEAAGGDLPSLQRLAMTFWDGAVEGSDNLAYRLAFNTLSRSYEKLFDLLTRILAAELEDVSAYQRIAAAIRDADADAAEAEARALTRKGEAGLLDALRLLSRENNP